MNKKGEKSIRASSTHLVAVILEDSSPSKTIHGYSSDSFLISHPHTYILLSTNLPFLRGSCVVISLENDLGIQNSTPVRSVVSTFATKLGASWIGGVLEIGRRGRC